MSQDTEKSGSNKDYPNDKNKTETKKHNPLHHHNRRRYRKKRPQNTASEQALQQQDENIQKLIKPNQVLSVVIPLYNEEESLMELSLALKKVFDRLKCNYEVIFIDDGSNDNSFKIIQEIHSRNRRFHCIKFRRNYGKSAALSAGFESAKGDIIITMDADLQDDPEEIPELIKELNAGNDLVSGWKKIRYDPFIKRNSSKLFNFVTGKISGVKLHDFNCGLKAYRSNVIKSIKVYGEMHRYIPALAYMSGFKVSEIPVKHHARKYGKTKYGISRFFNGFFDLLTVMFTSRFSSRPMHLFGLFGILSFFMGFLVTLYLTYLKLFQDKPLSDRPLFIVGVLFIIVGIQLFSLGLIAEMMTKNNVKNEEILIEKSF